METIDVESLAIREACQAVSRLRPAFVAFGHEAAESARIYKEFFDDLAELLKDELPCFTCGYLLCEHKYPEE